MLPGDWELTLERLTLAMCVCVTVNFLDTGTLILALVPGHPQS